MGKNITRLRENRPEHIFVGWALNTALDAAFGMVVAAHNGKALNQQSAHCQGSHSLRLNRKLWTTAFGRADIHNNA